MIIVRQYENNTQVPITDRGLSYGDGLWETIALRRGELQQKEKHLARLKVGIERLNIRHVDYSVLHQELDKLQAESNQDAVIKLTVTRGDADRGYAYSADQKPRVIIARYPMTTRSNEYNDKGIHLYQCATRLSRNKALAGMKHLNRLEQVLARAELPSDCQEGVMLDTDNSVIEGVMSNIFLIDKNDKMITPTLEYSGVEGIAREVILESIADLGLDVSIQSISQNELEQAKSIFLSNSLIKIWPVHTYNRRSYVIPEVIRVLQENVEYKL